MTKRARLKAAAQRLSHPFELLRSLSEPVDELAALADRYGSDKGARGNNYARVYSELFRPLRDRPVRLLEIGLLCRGKGWDDDASRDIGQAIASDAPSLRMWVDYFPRAAIFGLDFNDFSQVRIERCRIFRGDSGRAEDLQAVLHSTSGSLDIIIDDASHLSRDQQAALGVLFPALTAGGIYAIEDLTYQPPGLEPQDELKTLDLLRRAEVTGKFRSPHLSLQQSGYLEANVAEVAMFDSLTLGHAISGRDSLGVLRKKGNG